MQNLCASIIAGIALLAAMPAQAIQIYEGVMTGANEVPPNSSDATGFSTLTLDGNLLTVDVVWSDLEGGPAAVAHIHCCVAPGTNIGVAIDFPGFPGTTGGVYQHIFDLLDVSIYRTTFLVDFGGGTVQGAHDALVAGLDAGLAYTNIHNATFPGGEIRANLQAVPEPASLMLLIAGLGGLALLARRADPRRRAGRTALSR